MVMNSLFLLDFLVVLIMNMMWIITNKKAFIDCLLFKYNFKDSIMLWSFDLLAIALYVLVLYSGVWYV